MSDPAQAFDRILGELLIPLALAAGFPPALAQAYVRYVAHLRIYNHYGTGLGRPMRRRASIPQGCPYSMRFLAILIRPWLVISRVAGAVPRSLADDLMNQAFIMAIVQLLQGRQVGARQNGRCVTLALHAHSPSAVKPADPGHHVFVRRALAVRRAAVRQPDLLPRMRRIYTHYADLGRKGSNLPDPVVTVPMPRTTAIKAYPWLWETRPNGPVGLLMETCHQKRAALTRAFAIISHDIPDILLCDDPLQLVQGQVWRLNSTADFRVVAANRKAFYGCRYIDRGISMRLARTVPRRKSPPEATASRGARRAYERQAHLCRCAGLPDDYDHLAHRYRTYPKSTSFWRSSAALYGPRLACAAPSSATPRPAFPVVVPRLTWSTFSGPARHSAPRVWLTRRPAPWLRHFGTSRARCVSTAGPGDGG